MVLLALHLVLALLLFLIINWIGKHSVSVGYLQLSILAKADEAPAFNLVLRVFVPVVFLIIVSALLYQIGLDKYVLNIYMVSVYYVVLRVLFVLITNRWQLLNWYKQIFYIIFIVSSCYAAYEKIIKVKKNVNPDLSTIANELWVIIAIFLFQIVNKVSLPSEATIERKNRYIRKKFINFKIIYGNIVREGLNDPRLEGLAYAIMIYEDFNRPKSFRFIERLLVLTFKKQYTLGVMQVQSSKPISDRKSVELGVGKIYSDYQEALIVHEDKGEEYKEVYAYDDVIRKYNGGTNYLEEVQRLHEIVLEVFYKINRYNQPIV